ncbi:MAG: hypothetical protein MK074_02165 [Phycisphaerales bacterium]|nr:hypothetical protein [Phycisphaerales bacterium]
MYTAAATVMLMTACGAGQPEEVSVRLDAVRLVQVRVSPSTGQTTVDERPLLPRRNCPAEEVAHTDSDFGPGQYIVQAGFEQHEAAAASYVLNTDAFPVHFHSAEMLFATANATTQTTTEWSFELWQGTPDNGTMIESYASDGSILPHLVMPPGTTGTILQILVDPGDPEQIFIDDNPEHAYTVAFRIEAHHSPGVPCLSAPDPQQNAFPTTDVSGLASQPGNWIDAIDGTLCVCGAGWFSFQQFPSICTPSGDWVMRSTYTPFECADANSACCLGDGSCQQTTESTCDAIGGAWTPGNVSCADAGCDVQTGACCVESTGACVDVEQDVCAGFGGEFHFGQDCSDIVCFPEGACCTTVGECAGVMAQSDCELFGGAFMGDGTDCDSVSCPEPMGWCCPEDGSFCVDQTEAVCDAFGAVWGGAGTSCDDGDACNASCPGDLNDSGAVDVDDILLILSGWGDNDDGDADGDGDSDVDDLLIVLGNYGPC